MAPSQIKPNQGGLLQRGNAKIAPSQIKPNIDWFLQRFYCSSYIALPPLKNWHMQNIRNHKIPIIPHKHVFFFADAILVDRRGRDGHGWPESKRSKTGGFCSSGPQGRKKAPKKHPFDILVDQSDGPLRWHPQTKKHMFFDNFVASDVLRVFLLHFCILWLLFEHGSVKRRQMRCFWTVGQTLSNSLVAWMPSICLRWRVFGQDPTFWGTELFWEKRFSLVIIPSLLRNHVVFCKEATSESERSKTGGFWSSGPQSRERHPKNTLLIS